MDSVNGVEQSAWQRPRGPTGRAIIRSVNICAGAQFFTPVWLSLQDCKRPPAGCPVKSDPPRRDELKMYGNEASPRLT